MELYIKPPRSRGRRNPCEWSLPFVLGRLVERCVVQASPFLLRSARTMIESSNATGSARRSRPWSEGLAVEPHDVAELLPLLALLLLQLASQSSLLLYALLPIHLLLQLEVPQHLLAFRHRWDLWKI